METLADQTLRDPDLMTDFFIQAGSIDPRDFWSQANLRVMLRGYAESRPPVPWPAGVPPKYVFPESNLFQRLRASHKATINAGKQRRHRQRIVRRGNSNDARAETPNDPRLSA